MGGSPSRRIRVAGVAAVVVPMLLAFPNSDAIAQQGPLPKRLCKQRIEWNAMAATRADAQRKAIEGWSTAAAGQYGDGFTRWTTAGVARVSCTLTPEGHRCRAAASPCRDLDESARPAKGPGHKQ